MNTDADFLNKLLNVVNEHQINLSEQDIFDLLKITNRWPIRTLNNLPTINVISQWGGNYDSEFFSSGGVFIFDKWKKTYEQGFTSILTDILDLSEELRNLDEKIFKFSGKKTHANFYLTKGTDGCENHRVSLPPHSHDYNVIVKMIYGKCKWKIGEKFLDLTENDTILVPAGTLHSVVECRDKKLSLTINLE
jgi:mannose-6-phosphate isomerase-like protein (cupin superfamily)